MSKRSKKNNQRRNCKSSNQQSNIAKSVDPPPKKTNGTNEEKTTNWYQQKTAKILYGITSLIIIPYLFYLLSAFDSNKSTQKIINTIEKGDKNTIDTVSQLMEIGFNIVKEQPQVFQKQLKQYVTQEEYEKNKKIQQKKFEESQKSNTKNINETIDSVLQKEYNLVIRTLNSIGNSKWSQIFDEGYAIFKIGLDRKLYITLGSFNSKLKVNWDDAKIQNISSDKVDILLPTTINTQTDFMVKRTTIGIIRRFDQINKIRIYLDDYSTKVYCGIIADNEDGIIGIIAFSSESMMSEKNIFDFQSLQHYTNIDFFSNSYQ